MKDPFQHFKCSQVREALPAGRWEGEDEAGGERGLLPAQLLPHPRQHLQLSSGARAGLLRLW